jgi:6-pyruvoyltetrahydropterin/6-carboxytetrahydropterin synthase
MSKFQSTKVIDLGSAAFRQWRATHSHCQYLHGYRLTAKVWLGSNSLDPHNWVYDFGDFDEIKSQLRNTFDHKTVVAADDPKLDTFIKLNEEGIIQLVCLEHGVGVERFTELVYNEIDEYVKSRSNGRVWCSKVEVFEHENNSATFSRDQFKSFVQPDDIQDANANELVHVPPGKQPEVPVPVQQQPTYHVPRPAPVGQRPTTGLGNLFGGTTWGE